MAWVRSGERVEDREDMLDRARRAAAGLERMGVGPGDVVALYLRNDFAFFEASNAASQLGAYPTPVNWHNSPAEAAYVFENSGAKAIVVHADLLPGLSRALPEGVPVLVVDTPPEVAAAYGVSTREPVLPRGAGWWRPWLAQHQPLERVEESPPGTMIYTSGTTGHPKGVRRRPLTPEQREGVAEMIGLVYGYADYRERPEEVVAAITGPMYHSAPNGYGLTFFALGANILLQPRFDPEGLLADIERHGITHLHMVPTMFVRLLKLPAEVRARYDLSSLRHVVHAAAPCPPHVKHAMIDWWGPIINEYYGGTETSAVTHCTSEEWLAHPGTVGRALPHAELKVLAGERQAATGAVGEIVCRLNTMADFTYHGDDAKRRAAEKAGLIALGDVGYLDQDGFLYLCDRVKDMIISGGVNIYPAEIEAELHKMPGVADCAVFGVPDEEFGEQVCAFVQPQPGQVLAPSEVQAFLKPRIAGYKIPRRIEFHHDLPREDSGKIFKRKLREPFWSAHARNI